MLHRRSRKRGTTLFVSLLVCAAASSVRAQQQEWTLESATQRALAVAPQRLAADARVAAQKGMLDQAGKWPNPSVELGADNTLGKEDGEGGTDFTQFTFKQPIPLSGRIAYARKQARSDLNQAESEVDQQRLALEYDAARALHTLQRAGAELRLAEERLRAADELQNIGLRREQAGDLSRLERLRLDVVRETAMQTIATAEGEYSEALADFRTLLSLGELDPTFSALKSTPDLPNLADLESRLELHPTLVAATHGIESAAHGVDLARANRVVDPEVWLSRERDYIGGSRQDVTAVGVSVTLPLWDRGSGRIDTAQANKQKVQYERDALRLRLANQVRLNHLHLAHLIEQSEEYRMKVLFPAEDIFQLTRKGFAVGQVDILNLVDAVDTFFDARLRHLELLTEAWLEAAELRRSAGIALSSTQSHALEGNKQ